MSKKATVIKRIVAVTTQGVGVYEIGTLGVIRIDDYSTQDDDQREIRSFKGYNAEGSCVFELWDVPVVVDYEDVDELDIRALRSGQMVYADATINDRGAEIDVTELRSQISSVVCDSSKVRLQSSDLLKSNQIYHFDTPADHLKLRI